MSLGRILATCAFVGGRIRLRITLPRRHLSLLYTLVSVLYGLHRGISHPTRDGNRRSWGDSGELSSLNETARTFLEEGVNCVLSRPRRYATALPYIDTQRLSIALFGLATVQEIRELDAALVGSREISTRERRALEESIEDNQANVADEVWELCKKLKEAYDPSCDGFRRQNTPSSRLPLLCRNDTSDGDGREVFDEGRLAGFYPRTKPNVARGIKFMIDTPALLAATGST